MGAEYLYYAGLIAIALPLSPYSRTAAVVTAAGAAVIATWQLGAQHPRELLTAYMAVHVAALAGSAFWARSLRARFVVGLFAAMLVADLFELVGWFTAAEAWWTRLALALLQIGALPFMVDWQHIGIRLRQGRYWGWAPFERVGRWSSGEPV